MASGPLSIKDFGAIGDGTTDDTAAVNACLAACSTSGAACYVPSTLASYRLTATIVIPEAYIEIYGDGCGLVGFPDPGRPRGAGSWFYINHAGVGFSRTSVTTLPAVFRSIGTIRDQNTSGSPQANDYDFSTANGTGAYYKDVTLLNATKGIQVRVGRIDIDGLRGCPISVGVNIIETHDLTHIKHVHFWPYWPPDGSGGMNTYIIANGKAFVLGEVDGLNMSDVFTIHYNRGISCEKLGSGPRGPLALQIENFYFDNGAVGFYIDNACDSVTAKLSNGFILGSAAPAGSHNIDISGTHSRILIDNVDCDLPQASCLSVTGANSVVRVGTLGIGRWGFGGGNPFAVVATSTCEVLFSQRPVEVSSVNYSTNDYFSGTLIRCPLDSGSFSGTTNSGGYLTIPHNGGTIPRALVAAVQSPPNITAVHSGTFNATIFGVQLRTASTGVVLINTAAQVDWALYY